LIDNVSCCCSIEDPFETWYDVAHPVKDRGHRFIRKEFVVCHCMLPALSASM